MLTDSLKSLEVIIEMTKQLVGQVRLELKDAYKLNDYLKGYYQVLVDGTTNDVACPYCGDNDECEGIIEISTRGLVDFIREFEALQQNLIFEYQIGGDSGEGFCDGLHDEGL